MRPQYQKLVDELETAKHRLGDIQSREQLEQFTIGLLGRIAGACEVMDAQATAIEWCAETIRVLASILKDAFPNGPEFAKDIKDIDEMVAVADGYVRGL